MGASAGHAEGGGGSGAAGLQASINGWGRCEGCRAGAAAGLRKQASKQGKGESRLNVVD